MDLLTFDTVLYKKGEEIRKQFPINNISANVKLATLDLFIIKNGLLAKEEKIPLLQILPQPLTRVLC